MTIGRKRPHNPSIFFSWRLAARTVFLTEAPEGCLAKSEECAKLDAA